MANENCEMRRKNHKSYIKTSWNYIVKQTFLIERNNLKITFSFKMSCLGEQRSTKLKQLQMVTFKNRYIFPNKPGIFSLSQTHSLTEIFIWDYGKFKNARAVSFGIAFLKM